MSHLSRAPVSRDRTEGNGASVPALALLRAARVLAMAAMGLALAACFGGWSRHHRPPPPTELIVNGAPSGSVVFVDGTAAGPPVADGVVTQVVRVTPGDHSIDIHSSESVVYHEATYAAAGEHRVITVLSGKAL